MLTTLYCVLPNAEQVQTVPSKALPYGNNRAPAILDGSVPGDAGFDPVFLSLAATNSWANYFNGLTQNNDIDGFTWVREAELMNGRNAMMGVVGMIFPYLIGVTGNPTEVSGAQLVPVVLTMGVMEWFRINRILKEGPNYTAGDMQKWGPGEGERFNPFNLEYTPDDFEKIQVSEVKHGRLAMIGFWGLYFQAKFSGENIVEQLSHSFAAPEYAARAGYFLPDGI